MFGDSMPGEPIGMPGTAIPATFCFSFSSRFTSVAGTCPSTAYPSTTAVWHECAATGTLYFALTLSSEVCGMSVTVTSKPAFFMWSTHLEQQPQVGVLYTLMAGPA